MRTYVEMIRETLHDHWPLVFTSPITFDKSKLPWELQPHTLRTSDMNSTWWRVESIYMAQVSSLYKQWILLFFLTDEPMATNDISHVNSISLSEVGL